MPETAVRALEACSVDFGFVGYLGALGGVGAGARPREIASTAANTTMATGAAVASSEMGWFDLDHRLNLWGSVGLDRV